MAVALAMREEAPDVVRGAFIHDVAATPAAERARLARLGVDVFDSYAGAAVSAADRGLLDLAAARRVVHEARLELARVKFTDRTRAEAAAAWLDRESSWLGHRPDHRPGHGLGHHQAHDPDLT